MHELNLHVTSFSRKSRKYSFYKGTIGKIAPNRVSCKFITFISHQKITTVTTEFKYYEQNQTGNVQMKKLYLDSFMDMYNGEIISYKITKQFNRVTIMKDLADAVEATTDYQIRRTFRSDQG